MKGAFFLVLAIVAVTEGCSSSARSENGAWHSDHREENLNQRRAGMILKLEALLRERPLYPNKGDLLFRVTVNFRVLLHQEFQATRPVF